MRGHRPTARSTPIGKPPSSGTGVVVPLRYDPSVADLLKRITALEARVLELEKQPGDIEAAANELIVRGVRQARDAEHLERFEETRMRWVQRHRNEPGCAEHVAELEAAIKQAIPDPGDPPDGSSSR